MLKIGVLAFQGSVEEHIASLSKIDGIVPCKIKDENFLNEVAGLILPGGESTTIGKLIKDFNMAEPIVKRIREGMPVWGTCAGMILMAKGIVGENNVHLGVMDILVRRNAYGSQLDSFSAKLRIPEVSQEELPLVFIRAPWVEEVWGDVKVLAVLDGKIVAVRQGNMLATSFHPELTDDLSFHRYFAEMAKRFGTS